MNPFIVFGIAFIVFMGIDLVWLGFIAQKIYQNHLGYLMAEKVNWTAALIFYALFVGGIVYFVLSPSLTDHNITSLFTRAALYGLITYSTYDLTNLATVKNWPIKITLIDLVWGTFLSTSVSAITYWIVVTFLGG